jgi:zinc protease
LLKRYFIPVIVVLVALASVIYFIAGATTRSHDVRTAVPVEKFTLSNSLQVVVMPSDRIPVVSHMLLVKVGAGDDPYGKSGLAHYLEHLMFTGTPNYPEGEYDRAVNRVGGSQNASTNSDYTLYYATVPKEHLAMVMAMEADRFAHIDFNPAAAARELKVITEERGLRVENSPVSQWIEQLDAITFLNHPYRQPVIGWAEDMVTFTAADARAFYERYYRPSNMILLVAGDVSAREVRRYAQRYYGGLVAAEAPRRIWPDEPPMRMTRRGVMEDARVNEPRLMYQYIAPSAISGKTEDAIPLAVFVHYLGGGDTSALYTALVREQKLATSVSASYDPVSIGPGLFRIVAVPAPGVTLEQLEQALDRELTRVLATPLEAAALARAKTQLKAEIIFAQDGLQGLARVMAGLYGTGLDENYFYQWSDAIGRVNEQNAAAAAKAVLVPQKRVVGQLLPVAATPVVAPPVAPVVTPAPAIATEVPYGP